MSDPAAGSNLEDDLARIEDRLREIRAELGREQETDGAPIDDLLEEERLLLIRLQEIADLVADENTGIAERLVREEGAKPEEFPDLPGASDSEE